MGAELAARAVLESGRYPAGPVHINFPFREPLVDASGVPDVPAGEPLTVATAMPTSPPPGLVSEVADLVRRYERGVIVAGPADFASGGEALVDLARAAGWPLLAETTSQLRTGSQAGDGPVVATFDLWLRDRELAREFAPAVVFATGAAPTSKAVRRWLAASAPRHLIVTDPVRDLPDPNYLATVIADCAGPALAAGVAADVGALNRGGSWEAMWRRAETAATSAITAALEDAAFAEPAVMRTIAQAVPDAVAIYLSNSMPVRDADALWFTEPVRRRFFSNRGAAGIDGMVSAAAGAARGAGPVVLITGDLAFLHDLSGLIAVSRDQLPLVIVVLDNAGGGIFSTLPVAEVLSSGAFGRLFTTPHAMDLAALAGAAGVVCSQPASFDELRAAVVEGVGRSEPTVIHLSLDIDAGLRQRAELAAAAQRAVEAGLRE
jgi:2-succinyl-5-enolpyruvyl-6-hydroxy-3-cyclohexene-1-carboxylate synthase